jgi:N-acetylglucosamine-6-sulfatase
VIVTDDQRFDTLWAMPTVQTQLADRGVTFSNAFVVNPTCCPSRASILTGLYSHSSGVYDNKGEYGGVGAFDPTSTIATWLHDSGYRTGLIGKYLNGYTGTEVPPGWDVFDAFNESPETGLYYDYTMNLSGMSQTFGSGVADYSTNALGDLAEQFLSSSKGPCFRYLAPRAPHAPATPLPEDNGAFQDLAPWRPPSFNERDMGDKPEWIRSRDPLDGRRRRSIDDFRTAQYRSLLAIDRMVGDLTSQLDQAGELANTMIVFTSDNGMMWGEHRLTGKGVPYEESIRVPLVVRYDALGVVPHVDDRLVLNIDLAPTIAAAAGVTPPSVLDGQDLRPLLGDAGPVDWRSVFLIEHLGPRPPTYCAVRTKGFAFVAYRTGEEELYHLATDPFELGSDPDRYPRKHHSLLQRLRDLCDPPPPGFVPPSG